MQAGRQPKSQSPIGGKSPFGCCFQLSVIILYQNKAQNLFLPPHPPLPLGSFILCAVTPLAKRKKTNCYRRVFGTASRKNETVKFLLGTSSAPRGLTTTRIVVTSVCEGRRSLLRDGSDDNNKVAHPHSGISF